MMRTRTMLALAVFGASLAFAPIAGAEAKDKSDPPGASKAPKEAKKAGKAADGEEQGKGLDPAKKAKKGSGAPEETPPSSGDAVPPGLAGKAPGDPGMHGDPRPGKDGPRWSELIKKEKDGTLTEAEKTELEAMRAHPPPLRGGKARKARTNELEQKQASGTLTDEEKAELEDLHEKRARVKALDDEHNKRKADREKRRLESKREALRRFPGYTKNAPARDELTKHASRLAKLERAKDLAQAEERAELVARIDKLITKENERHEKWMTKHAATTSQGGTP